jgi:murein L,D-transpeptidase YafK
MGKSKAAAHRWLGLLLWCTVGPASALAGEAALPAFDEPPYEIEIDKSERVLLVKNGERVTRRFQIATGRGGLGDKRMRGDNKTPLGVYRVTNFNGSSNFHFFMALNYPNVKDAFFGLKRRLITRAEFDRIVDAVRNDQRPPQNTRLGSAIGIHGLGIENADKLKVQRNLDWTQGCIALTNRDVNELRNYVTVGTRVVIRE